MSCTFFTQSRVHLSGLNIVIIVWIEIKYVHIKTRRKKNTRKQTSSILSDYSYDTINNIFVYYMYTSTTRIEERKVTHTHMRPNREDDTKLICGIVLRLFCFRTSPVRSYQIFFFFEALFLCFYASNLHPSSRQGNYLLFKALKLKFFIVHFFYGV